MFTGKTLLITGGTGSFGNAVLQAVPADRYRARSASSAATRRSRKTCAWRYNNREVQVLHRRRARLRQRGRARCDGVDYVFHAAALKQVPSCEFYPMEAVRTNVLGAENVMNAAMPAGVRARDRALAPTRRSIRSTPWASPRR